MRLESISRRVRQRFYYSVPVAGEMVGLGRTESYRAAEQGQIPHREVSAGTAQAVGPHREAAAGWHKTRARSRRQHHQRRQVRRRGGHHHLTKCKRASAPILANALKLGATHIRVWRHGV
jgi:hypothetical protein